MNLVIYAHDVPLPPTLRTYAEGKVRRLDRHYDRILDARLELDLAARKSLDPPKVAELLIHVHGAMVKGKATAQRMQEAVDLVVDKVDEQLRRRKERIKDHKALPAGGKPRQ
jgi:putative sigma-54 modulation protein